MTRHRFEVVFGALCIGVFLALWLWQAPGGKLSAAEVARYVETVDRQINVDKDDKARFLAALKAWGEADDGQPVYMLNLMRFHDSLKTFPGAPDFHGTPRQSNEFYESRALPLLAERGGYAAFAGVPQQGSLVANTPDMDNWGRVLVVRYPSRRSFLELVADPRYANIAAYKFMALQISLVPMTPELILPDLRLIAGAVLLAAFLLTGWVRSARRRG